MRLVDVHKVYHPVPIVLAGVDLELEPGVPFVLGGANGSGKSTLLRIAAGCEQPTSGAVLDRPDVVGYLPDRFPALLRLPAKRYLRHLAAVHGADRASAAATADEVLSELGFTGEDGEAMSALSKGNAQKVGLAQALSCGAGVLVLDEPWSGLDVEAADALSERLAAWNGRLLVTDHTGTAERLPGARTCRIGPGGRLESDAGRRRGGWVRVEVDCRGPAREVLAGLPQARVQAADDRWAVVLLVPRRSDAWLAAALAAGCSVRSVQREHG